MNRPLVTIITPTYRHEAYIGECIESVLAQTYDNWEQIIVDDCSPDRTFEVAQSYRDPRIRAIRKPVRGGPSDLHASYNTALQMARGDLVAVLEGDDYWPPKKLEIQVPFHLSKNIAMSWGAYGQIRDGKKFGEGMRHSVCPAHFPDTAHLLIRNIIPALTVIASKEALEKVGGFWQPPGTVFVDHPTWLRLSRVGNILYIPRVLGYYRLHGGQISQSHQHKMSAFEHDYIETFLAELDEKARLHLDLKKIAAARCSYLATRCIEDHEWSGFRQNLLRACWGGDVRTKYQCAQMLLCIMRAKVAKNINHVKKWL